MEPRLDILFTLLAIVGIMLLILAAAGIVTALFTRKRRYFPQARYTKAGLSKREEAEEASRRG